MFNASHFSFGLSQWFSRPGVTAAQMPQEITPMGFCGVELDLHGWGLLKAWSGHAPLLWTTFRGPTQLGFNAPLDQPVRISVWNLFGARHYQLDTQTARIERWVNPSRLFQHHEAQSPVLKALPKERTLDQWSSPGLPALPHPSDQIAAPHVSARFAVQPPQRVWSLNVSLSDATPVEVAGLNAAPLSFDSPRVNVSLDELHLREQRMSVFRTPGP